MARAGTVDNISVYIPTHPKSNAASIKADKIRYKNALQEIKDSIESNEKLQATYKQLKGFLGDLEFWKKQNKSLALFATEESIELQKLPIETSTKTAVTSISMKTPILLAKELQEKVLVIDVSLNHVRAFLNSYDNEPTLLSLNILPIDEYLEQDYQDNQQFHNPAGNRKADPQFHGHGGKDDQSEIEVDLYMNYLVSEVLLQTSHYELPIVLSGEKNRVEQFRRTAQLDEGYGIDIIGNNESTSIAEINDMVNDRISELRQHKLAQEAEKLLSLKSDKKATEYKDILDAIKRSAVEKIYVPLLRRTRDSVRPGTHQKTILDISKYDEKLEKIIQAVRRQGGSVLPVFEDTLPNKKLLAELRF